MSKIKLSETFIKDRVKLALAEDLFPDGDITTSLLNKNENITAKLVSNQKAIVAGLLFTKHTFNQVDKKIKFILKKSSGFFDFIVGSDSMMIIMNEKIIIEKINFWEKDRFFFSLNNCRYISFIEKSELR